MDIDVKPFREKYNIKEDSDFAYYKHGKCVVCGKDTTQCDAAMLWYGIVTYLCSDECYKQHWQIISLTGQTKEE